MTLILGVVTYCSPTTTSSTSIVVFKHAFCCTNALSITVLVLSKNDERHSLFSGDTKCDVLKFSSRISLHTNYLTHVVLVVVFLNWKFDDE